jgi:hypothetical protein
MLHYVIKNLKFAMAGQKPFDLICQKTKEPASGLHVYGATCNNFFSVFSLVHRNPEPPSLRSIIEDKTKTVNNQWRRGQR